MAKKNIIVPRMGEGIIEVTLTKWLKNQGDAVEEDEPVAEVATDKVDTELTSAFAGVLSKTLYNEGDIVPVGETIAVVETENMEKPIEKKEKNILQITTKIPDIDVEKEKPSTKTSKDKKKVSGRFYSPLIKSIAAKENISIEELGKITGSGKNGRIIKDDIFNYLNSRKNTDTEISPEKLSSDNVSTSGTNDEIVEMDRMRRLIADNMVMSVKTSPHVTSFIDVDLTRVVTWREKVKEDFLNREKVKLTFTPIFFEAAALALKEFPKINASVDGYNIILHKDINIGMATALPNGNLIVPVIKNSDKKNLTELAKEVNDLALRARNNKLMPQEIMGGTFTITNFGSFDSLTGTPIINQPQVAILAIGAIRKKPVVLETDAGDVIAIRNIVIISMAYDHRIVDGAMGGLFLKKLKNILENWDINRKV